ncbi:MAG: preprotein translocase subunit SecY [Clostridia bacterium]|nr:preprotein translocase subunit SecY [Clostridia bacterium]
MLQTLRNAWKIPDLRKKMLFTVLMVIIFRMGSYIPVPGLDAAAIEELFGGFSGGMQGLLNNFSGGAMERGSIFAMSISPYINASIIMQLLTVAIPALERLSKEGEEGRKKISSYTRYATVVLGFLQAMGLFFGLKNSIAGNDVLNFFVVTLTFTAGTAFLMWLGEQITEKGIGNGISILIFIGIVSRGPAMIQSLRATLMSSGDAISISAVISIVAILVISVLMIAFVVFMNDAERRIPVQYAKRVVGRKMYGGQSTHIPIKVAMAGVIPIIFAVSIMSFPQTINMFINGTQMPDSKFWAAVLGLFQQTHPFYIIAYFLLILFFTYFYTAIQFNPIEMANNMKKNGGFIPGIRPGKSTSDYISKVLSRITLVGALFLAVIAIFPILMAFIPNMGNISIGGTSLLIVVGVALETVKQIESMMLMRHYKGFLE